MSWSFNFSHLAPFLLFIYLFWYFLGLSHTPFQNDSPTMKKAVSLLSLTTPNSNRKRRRLRDTLAQLAKETEISPFPPPHKRPSAEHNLSMGSLLDLSNTPDTCKALAGNDGGQLDQTRKAFCLWCATSLEFHLMVTLIIESDNNFHDYSVNRLVNHVTIIVRNAHYIFFSEPKMMSLDYFFTENQ